MQNQVMSRRPRATVLPLFLLILVVAALPANAREIAVGSAWIHRDAPAATEVQLLDDLLCSVEFQEQCFGGMMAPDSLLCVLETDRKSTRLNSSHTDISRMPSSA